ncbi:MAG: ribonuclease E activity regulator RraA [Xanthomonadales bacterium]|nr:ribonuclease E activity regulator RraA [Xanthomonadales bacterium]
MSFATADLSDAHPEARCAEPLFQSFGARLRCHGRAHTLKVYEDNSLVRETLERPGEGRVLVIDGGGSARCALVGGNLADLAVANAWAGIWLHGFVRDRVELAQAEVAIHALGSHPRKSNKGLHGGAEGLILHFAGIAIAPGEWVYADEDGIVVASSPIHLAS